MHCNKHLDAEFSLQPASCEKNDCLIAEAFEHGNYAAVLCYGSIQCSKSFYVGLDPQMQALYAVVEHTTTGLTPSTL